MPLSRTPILHASSQDRQTLHRPLPLPGTRPPAPELTQATSSRFLRAATVCSGGPAQEGSSPRARVAHAPRSARCHRCPPGAWSYRSLRQGLPPGAPLRPGRCGIPGTRNRYASAPRTAAPAPPDPALAPYLQQLHVARREPATEPVLLLAFPPAAVRDLQQRDQLARGEAQPLAVPLPREGVQGPAASAGHGLGARVHRAACIPAEPHGLGSGSAGSQAPGAPGSRALGARRLWGARGSPGRRGTRARRREAETRWLRRASGDAPGPGSSRIPALGWGAGLRGRRPRRRGLRRQLPGNAERGLQPPGPARAGATPAHGNAQLPWEVGPGASPAAGLRGAGGSGWRPWRGAGGRVAGRGLARGRGGGPGRDQGGHARGGLRAPSQRGLSLGRGVPTRAPTAGDRGNGNAPVLCLLCRPGGP